MPIIDFHTHAFTDALAPSAIPALEAQGGLRAQYDGTVSGLVAEMDRAGVDVSVVQPVATKPGQVAAINDWAVGIQSDRIVAFGAMHPDFAEPAAEMARVSGLGLRGIKMHPEHQAFDPGEPRLDAIYSAAIEHNMIVFFHAGADVIHPTVHGTPEAFAAVLDAWPDLTAVLAHLGGFQQWEGVVDRIVGRDVWLDTAYTPRHLPDAEMVALMRAHGTDRILFGSDGPWTDPAVEITHLRSLDLSEDEIEGVLGGNAERLLAAHER